MKVPEYTPTETLRPAFRQSIDVTATPEAFGADIGRGLQKFGAGLGDLATSVSSVQALDDVTRAKEADTNYAGWLRERQYGENGYMLTEGKNAVDGRAAFEKEVEEKRKEYGAGLSGGAARHYSTASTSRTQSSFQSAIIHSANGRKKWVGDASNARVDSFGNDAMVNSDNPAAVEKNIAAGQAELRQQGELHGWDAETLKGKEQAFVSGVTKNIALKLAEKGPLAAQKYVEANGARLTGDDRLTLDKTLKAPMQRALVSGDADRVLGGAPAPDDQAVQSPLVGAPVNGLTNDAKPLADKSPVAPAGKPKGSDSALTPNDPAPGQEVKPVTVPGMSGAAKPDARGNYHFADVASSMIGVNENRDTAAIASFIKRYAGVEIDPRRTAWCAAFVNAVLGSQGVKGTGKLNARSFLNFGTATDNPREGDIAVFSRGGANSGSGHVGFFKGFDAQGNVIIVGGNQSNSVSTTTMSADKLLGFRRASPSGSDTPMPNQTVAGLHHIESELDKVPADRRDAVRKEIASRIEFREKLLRVDREHMQDNAGKWLIANPSAKPDDLPLEVRQGLGVSGMTTLNAWHSAVVTRGQPTTDDKVMADLQTQYADDPQLFGQMDLFKFRDRLSNSDWDKVQSWRQTARTDMRKAKYEGAKIGTAMTQAKIALEAAGVVKVAKNMDSADHARVAAFQAALGNEIDAFKREHDNRQPTEMETQSIINKLLLPIVIKTPGTLWDSNTRARAFEAGSRPDRSTVEMDVKYADIPIDFRRAISNSLEQENHGKKPSQQQITARYMKLQMKAPTPSR